MVTVHLLLVVDTHLPAIATTAIYALLDATLPMPVIPPDAAITTHLLPVAAA